MKRSFLFPPFDKKTLRAALSFLLLAIITLVALYIPNILPVGADFSALYYADLALVNPSDTSAVAVNLIPYDDQGRQQTPVSVQIPPNGRYSARTETIFPSSVTDQGGYLKVSANGGVVAEESISSAGDEVSTLGGIDASGGGLQLYSPQFAAGGNTWRSANADKSRELPDQHNTVLHFE